MTAAPVSPRYPGTTPGSTRWRLAARDAWSVQWRCQVVLVVLALGLAVATAVTPAGTLTNWGSIMAVVWLVHVVVTFVVGYPVGLVTGRLLPAEPSRAVAAGGFALAGAVAAALVLVVMDLAQGIEVGALVPAWSVLGAVVAGSARAWAHRAVRAHPAAGVVLRPHPGTWRP